MNVECFTIEPTIGVPYVPEMEIIDLRDRAVALCETAQKLHLRDFYPENTIAGDEDREIAAILATAYATDPEKTSKEITESRALAMPRASLVLVKTILDEFSAQVVHDSVRLRNLVTNKLILESDNPDARVRLRAVELLGKISDVGLFTDKKEVTITHTSSDELRASLKDKLSRLVATTPEASYEVISEE